MTDRLSTLKLVIVTALLVPGSAARDSDAPLRAAQLRTSGPSTATTGAMIGTLIGSGTKLPNARRRGLGGPVGSGGSGSGGGGA